jgi:hypothetical protein
MREFQNGEESFLQNTGYEVKRVEFFVPEVEGESEISQVISEFANLLDEENREEDVREHSAALDAILIDRSGTHLSVNVMVDFPRVELEFKLFYHYCDLEPVGPMIDGDVVLQGSSANGKYGPALCVVESENTNDEDNTFMEVGFVPPSKMIITPDNESETIRFMIPVSIEEKYRNTNLRVKIYAKPLSEIKYDNMDEELDEILSAENRSGMICSNVIIPQAQAGQLEDRSKDLREAEAISAATGEKGEGEESASTAEYSKSLIIKNIRVATDYDDVIALQNEGFELCCTLITPQGTISDQDHMWKFHVLAEFGSPEEPGLEDLMFIRCLKSLGTLPSIPFFDVLHDFDLSKPEDDVSSFLFDFVLFSLFLKSFSFQFSIRCISRSNSVPVLVSRN